MQRNAITWNIDNRGGSSTRNTNPSTAMTHAYEKSATNSIHEKDTRKAHQKTGKWTTASARAASTALQSVVAPTNNDAFTTYYFINERGGGGATQTLVD